MCKVLGIARSEYYYQINKKKNSYKEANEKLDKEIKEEYEKSKGRYGSPKIQKILEKRGMKASQKRVARRMKKMGLKSITVKKFKPSGSKGKVDDTNKPNLLAQNFKAEGLREKMVSEGTKELDNICKTLYGNLPSVTSARSINADDVNELTGITSEEETRKYNVYPLEGTLNYGDTYTIENGYTPESWVNGKQKVTKEEKVSGYMYYFSDKEIEYINNKVISNSRIIEMLNKGGCAPGSFDQGYYFLNTQSNTSKQNSEGIFGLMAIFYWFQDMVSTSMSIMFSSTKEGNLVFQKGGVRPVVILESNVTNKSIHRIEDQKEIEVWPNESFGYGG